MDRRPAATIDIIFFLASVIMFGSCSSTNTIPRFNNSSPAPSRETTLPLLPNGWADISSRSQLPQIRLWLINNDYSSTIVLRELHTEDSLLINQSHADPCLLAHISMNMKFAEGFNGKRVTRTPAVVDSSNNVCGYVYSENGLLRKVLVFEDRSRLFELELMQEKIETSFDSLAGDQMQILQSMLNHIY